MQKPPLRVVEGGSMDKQKALEAALAQIDKNFGKGSIMRLGANDSRIEVEAISTGSLGLDIALGIGGLPKGRVIEIYGPESSGKTTLSLQVLAEAQKKGGICAFVDAEHALDPVYARKLGVKVEDLLISQPDDGEQALEIADTLVRSGAVDVLVVDSVAALTPKAELEGEMGDMQPGMQARLMSKALQSGQGMLHIWSDPDEPNPAFTASGLLDWAFCMPYRGDASNAWCLYVSGLKDCIPGASIGEDHLKGNLRFAELLCEFIGSIRQVRLLSKQQAGLSQFFSPTVLETMRQADADRPSAVAS